MSASVLSIRIIGYKIPANRLYAHVRERGCSHEAGSSKFCGECGAPTWKYKEERMLHDSDILGNEFTVRTQGWSGDEVAYIGISLVRGFTSMGTLSQLLGDLEQRRERLHAELGKLGINYADCVFGLHLIAELC